MTGHPPGTNSEVANTWHVFQGVREGRPIIVRLDTAFQAQEATNNYSYRIGVAVPLRMVTDDGLPHEDESPQLEWIEDLLLAGAEERGVLPVAVISTAGMREFVFYAPDVTWVKGWAESLEKAVSTHEIQLMAEPDPEWEVYHMLGGAS